MGRRGRGGFTRGGLEARATRFRVAAQLRGSGRRAARVLAQRLRVQSVAASELQRGRSREAHGAHSKRGAFRAIRLRRGCGQERRMRSRGRAPFDETRVQSHGGGRRTACARQTRRVSTRGHARRGPGSRDSRRQSGQDCLSRFHLGHDGAAQRRAPFRQHVARQRPRHGARLASRRAHRALQPQPAVAPHRHGCHRAKPRRGLRSRRERRAGGHETARLDTGDRRNLRDGRARRTRWTSSPT